MLAILDPHDDGGKQDEDGDDFQRFRIFIARRSMSVPRTSMMATTVTTVSSFGLHADEDYHAEMQRASRRSLVRSQHVASSHTIACDCVCKGVLVDVFSAPI